MCAQLDSPTAAQLGVSHCPCAGPAPLWPHAVGSACVCTAAWGSDSHGACAFRLCDTECAVQESGRVGSGEGALGGHATTAEEHVMCARYCHTASPWIRSPPRAGRLLENLLACATQHGAGCGVQFVKEREPGSLELDARVQHALRMPSPLLLRGAAWWWGVSMGSAPERGWRRGGAVFSTATN